MITVLGVLMVCAWKQTAYWQDNETLWTHTLACTTDNDVAHYNLGDALFQKGRVDEAIAHFQKRCKSSRTTRKPRTTLAIALLQQGKVDEAITQFQKALQINPDYAEAHYNLGIALPQKGRVDEAITHFQKRCKSTPTTRMPTYNLGTALLQKGKVDEAIAHYQKALQINPDYAEAHYNLGNRSAPKGKSGRSDRPIPKGAANQARLRGCPHQPRQRSSPNRARLDEAIAHFQKALQINPGYAKAHNNLGNAFLQKGNVSRSDRPFSAGAATRTSRSRDPK